MLVDLKLVTDVTSEPITVSDVKAHLYITHSDDDTYLTGLIKRARKQIENYCSIAIGSQEWIWMQDCNGGVELQIPKQPVISVDAVSYEESSNSFVSKTAEDDYKISGLFEKTFTPFTYGRWRVEYTTGYETLPDDLKHGILCQVAYLYENRGDVSKTGLSDMAKDIVSPYKDYSWT